MTKYFKGKSTLVKNVSEMENLDKPFILMQILQKSHKNKES